MAEPVKHSVSVAGVVLNEARQVLIIQRKDNRHWEPPGGVLEIDESPQSGVRREVKEETGLDVEVDTLTGVYKNVEKGVVALVFRCFASTSSVETATSETINAQWVDRETVDKLLDEAYAVRVHDAFEATVAVRTHDGVVLSGDVDS
ncbi:NUDIX hydrolase [Pseudonocardia sp. ICBG1293]|uniref:NUDIX hydrolase n=1 Tax=Pseudonocardia sp. ICBG1293 TaxID=2844382 RepID=UPI001CCD4E1A|nr:NUDIX domain-containing protein [Pseudonocardia sp. ICBG1293]